MTTLHPWFIQTHKGSWLNTMNVLTFRIEAASNSNLWLIRATMVGDYRVNVDALPTKELALAQLGHIICQGRRASTDELTEELEDRRALNPSDTIGSGAALGACAT